MEECFVVIFIIVPAVTTLCRHSDFYFYLSPYFFFSFSVSPSFGLSLFFPLFPLIA